MGGKEVVENLYEEWWKKIKGVRGGRGRKEKEGSKERKQWFITWNPLAHWLCHLGWLPHAI